MIFAFLLMSVAGAVPEATPAPAAAASVMSRPTFVVSANLTALLLDIRALELEVLPVPWMGVQVATGPSYFAEGYPFSQFSLEGWLSYLALKVYPAGSGPQGWWGSVETHGLVRSGPRWLDSFGVAAIAGHTYRFGPFMAAGALGWRWMTQANERTVRWTSLPVVIVRVGFVI